jgi:hypothetical protein
MYYMDPLKFNDLLSSYKGRELPPSPTNLNQNVWREIRLRKSTPVSSALRYSEFLTWFRGSMAALVAPTLALAMVMSVGLTVLNAQATPHQRVQQALGLNVFSHQASPLTRFAQNP